MKPLRVVNVRHGKGFDTYMGRAGHGYDGYWGNPVVAGRTCPRCGKFHGTPGSTLPCFESYFLERVGADPEFRRRALALEGDLGCFCAPKRCHVDIIVAWVKAQRAS